MLTNIQAAHLKRAVSIAASSTCRQKHGVVIAQGKKVLAVSVNTYRNQPNNVSDPKTQSSYHAEWNAIKQIKNFDLKKATLYSARVNAKGDVLLAKPCIRCQYLIDFFEIKNVYHT